MVAHVQISSLYGKVMWPGSHVVWVKLRAGRLGESHEECDIGLIIGLREKSKVSSRTVFSKEGKSTGRKQEWDNFLRRPLR